MTDRTLKQQLLIGFAENAVHESLCVPNEVRSEELTCPECECDLEFSYDINYNQKYYCDNCECYVKGSIVLLVSDMDK